MNEDIAVETELYGEAVNLCTVTMAAANGASLEHGGDGEGVEGSELGFSSVGVEFKGGEWEIVFSVGGDEGIEMGGGREVMREEMVAELRTEEMSVELLGLLQGGSFDGGRRRGDGGRRGAELGLGNGVAFGFGRERQWRIGYSNDGHCL